MAVCTYNICLTGYACPVVTKATSSALYVEAIEGLCKNCKYADNIEDRLKNYNSVGSECLAFSSTKEPSVSPGTNSSPSNGPITKELPVTICVITLGILAVFLLTKWSKWNLREIHQSDCFVNSFILLIHIFSHADLYLLSLHSSGNGIECHPEDKVSVICVVNWTKGCEHFMHFKELNEEYFLVQINFLF